MAPHSASSYIVWLRQTLWRWRSRAAACVAVRLARRWSWRGTWRWASAAVVVRAGHLNHPVFRELLRQGLFKHVLCHLSSLSKSSLFVTLEDLKSGALSFCCVTAAGDSLPLLHGISADKAVW
uniref:Uncharacterized protein n=1 Tax=Setaria italica TaxID=4555 RepID=K4AL09_SETIT